MGETFLKVASSKVVKYEKTYSDNQHNFKLAFDTFDFITSEPMNFILQRVKRLMHNNVVFSKSMDLIFKIIDFAI